MGAGSPAAPRAAGRLAVRAELAALACVALVSFATPVQAQEPVTVAISAAQSRYLHKLSNVTWRLTRTGTAVQLANGLTVSVTMSQSQSFMSSIDLARTRTATFARNATRTTLTIPHTQIQGDTTAEGTLTATVTTGSGYVPGTPGSAETTMKVGNPAVTVGFEKSTFLIPENYVYEDGEVYILATLAPGLPRPNVTLTVALATEDDVAVAPHDYIALSETVEITPRDWFGRQILEASIERYVTIVNDELVEPDESLNLFLKRTASLPTGAVELVTSRGTACPVVDTETRCSARLIIEADFDEPPRLRDAAVTRASLRLGYYKVLDENSKPAKSAFTVMVNNSPVPVIGVAVEGDLVRLTLGSVVLPGQTVTMSYAAPDSNPLRDTFTNPAAALSAQTVENATTTGGVQGDLRLADGPNESEGRLEVYYQGLWGTVCDDRFTSPSRPRSGGAAEPNRAAAVACRIMGYEGAEFVSGHTWLSRASLAEKPIWLDDVRCLAGDPAHNAGDGDRPTSLFDCYNAGPALHNCSREEDVGLRCTGTLTEPADVRGPGVFGATLESTGRVIELIFEENLATQANRLPPLSAFELTVDGILTPIAGLTGPGQDGLAADQIRLRVDNAIPTGKRINIYYTDPSAGNDTAAIQDEAGNDAESFYVGAKRSDQSSEGLSVADAQATEGTDASLAFVVTLAPAATATVTVDYATADGTATEGDDYTTTTGTLTFAPSETTKTIAVPIVDDNVEDDGETLTLTLSNAVGADIVDADATGTIRNTEEETTSNALTATFQNLPAEHTGEGDTFDVRILFDAPLSGSWTSVRDAITVTNGTHTKTHRVDGRSDLWNIRRAGTCVLRAETCARSGPGHPCGVPPSRRARRA